MDKRPVTLSPFELDIAAQPDALREFAQASPAGLASITPRDYDRIILTGMGSSHFAALPSWRQLVADGRSAWWVDTGQLLDSPCLITEGTLLVITSQSGASGEIAALLGTAGSRRQPTRPLAIAGITNDPASPLGRGSDAVLRLHSGPEATVSTKSYLNSLAAHQQLLCALTSSVARPGSAADTAKLISDLDPAPAAAALAEVITTAGNPRIAFVGTRDHGATALYAGLITKEAAKIAAEGFIGGQFRHGPLELAGPGLAAILFGAWADDTSGPIPGLAADLAGTGADVTLVGDLEMPGTRSITIPRGITLTELAAGAIVAQHIAVQIARARGIEPGAFAYGRKVTTTL